MYRILAVWFLLGALGLAGYDAYIERETQGRVGQPAPAEAGAAHAMEGGNGLPPPVH
jgi:hypothetical protein